MTLKSYRASLLYYIKLCASSQTPRWIQTGVIVWKPSIRVKIGDILSRVTFKFDGWPWKTIGHLFYVASSSVHLFIAISKLKLKLVWKHSIRVKIGDLLPRVTLKFNGWPWKTIGHLFYVASRFMHHFIAISEFKLKLQSGNAQFGSKLAFFCPVWPWNFMDDIKKKIRQLFYATSSFVHHFVAIGEFKLELQSGNAQFGSKSTIFLAVWPSNLTDDLEKLQGTSPKQYQAFCIISSSYVNSNWSYSPETAKLGYDHCDLDLWPMTLTFGMDITSVIGNNFWNFVMIQWREHRVKVWQTDRQTDGRTDGQTDRQTERGVIRAAWSQLKIHIARYQTFSKRYMEPAS